MQNNNYLVCFACNEALGRPLSFLNVIFGGRHTVADNRDSNASQPVEHEEQLKTVKAAFQRGTFQYIELTFINGSILMDMLRKAESIVNATGATAGSPHCENMDSHGTKMS